VDLRTSGEPLKQMGERDAQALAAGPLIGLLTSTEETEAAWSRAGLAWQHLTLAARTRGLAVAPLTAIVENPATRRAASAYAPAGQHLQMLFRLGKSPGPLPPPHGATRPGQPGRCVEPSAFCRWRQRPG
jgi:hypothetical protein